MNLDRYKKDLETLIAKGDQLYNAMQHECRPEDFARAVKQKVGDKAEEVIQAFPSFKDEYQQWYSEALTLVRQLLPDRLSDFTDYYERPKSRKLQDLSRSSYVIADYLNGTIISDGLGNEVAGPEAAIPKFRQQLNIVKAMRARFRSSLFDIRQLVQADLFDSELDSAKELAKNKFTRAAGAVAGVVLERHLKEVCGNRGVKVRKKEPQISDLNDILKGATVIDTPEWLSIKRLGVIRNLCGHDKKSEPTTEQVEELIRGVEKVTKTLS